MNLYFFTQARLCRIDGVVWSTPAFSMPLWERYLQVFDHIFVVARILKSSHPIAEAMQPIIDDRVTFVDLPYYVGPLEYLKQRKNIDDVLGGIIHVGDAYLCRVPGRIGSMVVKHLLKLNIPYGLEIVGDPWESMSPQATRHILSPFFQVHGYFALRKLTKHTSAALYVTKYTLQRKYPVSKGVFTTNASNVIIRKEYISERPKEIPKEGKSQIRLLAVGTLAQLYKAPDIVVKAVSEVLEKGRNVTLTWLGGGQYLDEMEKLAESLGIRDKVNFAGAVSLETVRQEMANSDLFIHASRAEGLPRALIEAMACGLPAIGSTVAGIPELLDTQALVAPNSVKQLTNKILTFIDNPGLMNEQAIRNWHESQNYMEEILSRRRLDFYKELKKVSLPK